MEAVVNGNKEKLEKGTNILEFIKSKGTDPEQVVVEYNGKILDDASWADTVIEDGDRLEILKFVGGG